MRRSFLPLLLLAAACTLGFSGRSALAQGATQSLTPAQQIISRYLLPTSAIPSNLKQSGDPSPLDNWLTAAFAEDPAEIQNVISRGRLDGLEQDLSATTPGGPQTQIQVSLFKDAAGASADVADPILLAGLPLTPVSAPNFGDASAAYTTKTPDLESTNIVFSSGRLEMLVSELGPPGSTNQADIIPIARLLESRAKLPVPPPTKEELAVLQTQASPEAILKDAYEILIQLYPTKLPPSQLLTAAYNGASKALTDAGVTSGIPEAPSITADDADAAWAQFLPTYQAMEKLAPSSLSASDLAHHAATELYNNLNCHTTFFDPTEYTKTVADLKGAGRARLGVSVGKFDSSIAITQIEPNSPAEQAGLKAGDVIVAIDGQPAATTLDKLSTQLTGPAGSPVALTVQRYGTDQPFDITVVRQVIQPVIEQHRVLPGGIGYIQFNDFTDGDEAVTDLKRALSDFAAAGVNSWILDLRNNGGGSQSTLEQVAGLFVPQGSLLITETMQDGTVSTARSVGTPPPDQKSMVILTGKGTASAAEILTESLKDLGRVTVVGDTSAGCVNGGVFLGLLDGAGMEVSTLDVRSGPNKVPLEKIGVVPDVQLSESLAQTLTDIQQGKDPVLEAGVDLFTGQPIPAPAPQPSGPSSAVGPPVAAAPEGATAP